MEELKNSATDGTGEATEGTTNTAGSATERTFTQADVNRIVQDRLAKEKGKENEELTRRTAELDARERRMNAMDELAKHGLPSYLVDALNISTDEDFNNSIDIIKRMKGETGESTQKSEHKIIGKGDPIGVVQKSNDNDAIRRAFGL